MTDVRQFSAVRSAMPRFDADLKVTGAAKYTNDLTLPRMLQAKVLRSPHAHAWVRRIDASRAASLTGVAAIVTRDDLVGLNATYGYYMKDQPIVATDKVRYLGDMVAAVAAETEEIAVRALGLIEVDYEPLPTLATIEAALAPDAPPLFDTPQICNVPVHGPGSKGTKEPVKNVCYRFNFKLGDPGAFAQAEHLFEDEFLFSRMQHYHLEPFVTLAQVVGRQIELWSSCQNPFPLRKELARIFKHAEQNIRVHVPFIGAGFGAKNNCKTEPIAILLAKKAGRPVRFCLTQEENFLTQSQHAAILRLRTGIKSDGTFVARQSRILLNAGAYSDASPMVAEKSAYRIKGPYRWQHIDAQSDCVMTNTTPAGPFRGFGGTQAAWASESQIDMISRRLGLDPVEVRNKNLLKLGEPFVPGESGMDSDLHEGLDIVCREIGYYRRTRVPGRGIGVAIGAKDSGGNNKPAQAQVKTTLTGGVIVNCGGIEIGQGIRTAMTRIVAELFNCPVERVSYAQVDTDNTPYDSGTNASSGIVVMGQAIELAARDCIRQIVEFAAGKLDCGADDLRLEDWNIVRNNEAHPLMPMIQSEFGGLEFSGRGFFKAKMDHAAPLEAKSVSFEIGWGAAEVVVDEETGKIDVLQLIVSGDAGLAIHKDICRGQDEGAAIMGLGQALFETMQYDGPVLTNIKAANYRVPLAKDVPPVFRAITQEQGHGPGPFGAKGMGEGGMLPIAAAIANAVEDAVGVRVTSLPITPEKVLAALRAKRVGGSTNPTT